MIPCQICGKDSGAHWVTGYIPAPDSLKMALCADHDTPENRRDIRVVWYKAMVENIRNATRNAAYFATRGALFMLTINYTAGGSLSLPCLDASITSHNTLRVTSPDGSLCFFPMQHIKQYDLMPVAGDVVNKP